MIRVGRIATLGSAVAVAFAVSAYAANTLDELLEQTRTARQRESKENVEREKVFQASRDQQAALLAQAEGARRAAEAESQRLSAQYDAWDKELTAVDTMLKERAGHLGELFGVTRQVAGDTATVLSQSVISVQFPDREDFFRKLAGSKELPSGADLERMWFEMQREMTESGRVARFQHKIVQADGQPKDAEVVRIGPFIAMSDGEFLSYLPSQKALVALSRQPPGEFTSAAAELQEATEGYVEAPVDPSRGVLLALYVERPNIWERIEKGELVGYIIILVGVIGTLCAIYQFFYLFRVRGAVKTQLANLDRPTPDNPLGRVLLAFKGDPNRIEEDAEIAELRISEAVLKEVPTLERFQAFLRLAVAAGPLLGLVGTVIGMIITFQSITESGSSDPKLMATGIGQAMIATVLGLGIAIPLLFINTALQAMSRQIVQILDEQSTGLLAESIEKRKKQRVA